MFGSRLRILYCTALFPPPHTGTFKLRLSSRPLVFAASHSNWDQNLHKQPSLLKWPYSAFCHVFIDLAAVPTYSNQLAMFSIKIITILVDHYHKCIHLSVIMKKKKKIRETYNRNDALNTALYWCGAAVRLCYLVAVSRCVLSIGLHQRGDAASSI